MRRDVRDKRVRWTMRQAHAPSAMLEALEARQLLAFDPTAQEQYMLELTNRMRLNPAAELGLLTSSLGTPARSANADIDGALRFFNVSGPLLQQQWNSLTPAPPLAWNDKLYLAAEGHNNAMIAADLQTHQAPGEPGLGQRATNAGYTGWSNLGESVYAFSRGVLHGHAGFALDWGNGPGGIQDPPGHRDSMMNPLFREVGIRIMDIGLVAGRDVGPQVITQDFGRRFHQGNSFLLGVVYADTSSNGYSVGEGLGGVTITAVGANGTPGAPTFTTTSMSEGGWQMQLPAGTYAVTFAGAGFGSAVTYRNIVIGAENVKLDAVRGAAPPAPVIQVRGNGVVISSGDSTPSVNDSTNFGNANLDRQSVTRTFTITNAGNQVLRLSGTQRVVLSGANAGDFEVLTDAGATIAPGASTTFTVRFDPSDLGSRVAMVTILSDDGATPTYTFSLRGGGVRRPIVEVKGKQVVIASGDSTPTTADWTNFGGVDAQFGSKVRIFTLGNVGLKNMTITGVTISGADAGKFTVFVQPATTLAAGATSQFRIRFVPGGMVGFANAVVTVTTDDPVTPAYTFALRGNGLALPRMQVSGAGVAIAQGDATPAFVDRTNFLNVVAAGARSRVRLFTITNIGFADLQFTGPQWVAIGGVHASDFVVTAQPASGLISAGQSVTFKVRFNPSDLGPRGAVVTIATNDPVFGTFTFAIGGVGV